MERRLAVLLSLLILSLGALTLTWSTTSSYIRVVIDGLLLPFKVARLVALPPDETLTLPVEGVRVRDIADTWGEARSDGRTHEGQDIFAPRGTPIYPAARGYVVRVGENRLGGRSVFILGEGGRRYYYAHLDAYGEDAKLGTLVTEASVIGYVGNTGNAAGTPPHLHFGVYDNGPMNPYPYLVDRAP
jgi:murein DD-endopeptidase MepM/ murein hydrolase activator NlpD